MNVAMSKGKTVKGCEATFVLKNQTLLCDLSKLGKMPGKIKIELPVKVGKDGSLSAEPESEAGVMKMPMGFKFKLRLEKLENAWVDGHEISFTLKVYGQMMGTKYPTSIDFRGEAK